MGQGFPTRERKSFAFAGPSRYCVTARVPKWHATRGRVMGVRCADCGLLSLRKDDGSPLVEANDPARAGEASPTAAFVCFVRAFDLPAEADDELRQAGGLNPERFGVSRVTKMQMYLKVIRCDRTCGEFMTYWQGFSPKERQQMRLEEMTRKSIEERDKAQREWQAAQAERAERVAEERRQEDKRRDEERRADDRRWQRSQEEDRRRWQSGQSFKTIVVGAVAGLIASFIGNYFGLGDKGKSRGEPTRASAPTDDGQAPGNRSTRAPSPSGSAR